MKRDILNSPHLLELNRKKRKVFLKKTLFLGFGLLAILVGLAYISRINRLNINEIEIVGNKVVDTEMIKEAAQKEITGYYFWIFPKTNVFFYSKNNIKNKLFNQFKRLKNITLSIQDKKTLEVSVVERIPQYTWCGITLPLQADLPDLNDKNQKCYFLDETGYIFDEAPYFSGEVYFKFYGLTHESYFSQTNFEKLISFKKTLETMELKPVVLYIVDDGNIKIYLSNESSLSAGPEIIFKTDSDFLKITENLRAALSTEPLQSDFKNKYSSLLYIDLRFGNKVFYKFR